MSFVLQELVDTEKEYVDKMNDVVKVGVAAHVMQIRYATIQDYLPEMASGELPESLVYKDRIIFGNIEDLYAFHSK